MSLGEKLKVLDAEMGKRAGAEKQNTVRITGAACTASFLLGTGKLLMGVVSLSFFTCMNALYTYGMVAAKICALRGLAVPARKQYAEYKRAAGILILSSIFYALYSARLLCYPQNTKYHPYLAMGIATVTFAEIGLNLWGMLAEQKKKAMTFHALKTINLASALIGLVLTQAALLSFTHDEPGYDPSASNGILGLCMGGCAALLGCFMLWRGSRLRQQEENK